MPGLRNFISVFFLLMTVPGFWAVAQDPVSRHYTVDDGLPSNEVYDIFEDSLGYLWFATDHGISRFDGYEFKNYSTNDGLTHNTIFGFFEDHHRRIWMRAFNSTICYMKNGKIHPYAHNDSLQQFLGRHFIQTFAIDSIGDLWFMPIRKPYGLYHQDHVNGRIKKVPIPKGYNAFIRELGHNQFIAGVDFSDTAHQVSTEVLYRDHTWLLNASFQYTHANKSVVRAAKAEGDHYLFSYNEMLVEIATKKLRKHRSFGDYAPVTYLYADHNKQVWATGQGLFSCNNDTLLPFFSDLMINSIRQDRRGSYWLATSNNGILFIPNMAVSVLKSENSHLPYLLTSYKEQLIGIRSPNHLSLFPLTGSGPGAVIRTLALKPFNARIHDISIDVQNERLLMGGCMYATSSLQHKDTFNFKQYFVGYKSFVRSSFGFGEHIYLAGNHGWGITDAEGKIMYLSQQDKFTKFCSSICLDSSRRVWIGATDGLYTFRNDHTEAFHASDSTFRQNVTAIKCMPDGLVAISTRGRGIIFIDQQTVYTIRAADGLSSDLCGRLVVDGNILWVCTNKGLNKITVNRKNHKLTFEVIRLQTQHGLPSDLIYDATRYKDLLILATGKGMAWFNVNQFTLNDYTPPVYIDAVYANKRLIGKDSLLSYTESNLSFGFTGLLYNSAGKIQYRYKLDGYETEWNYTMERTVHYLNVPAGRYTFVVAAMNENGIWSAKPGSYAFVIPLHYTKTWWFLLVLIVFGLAVLWLTIRYYFRQRRAQERMKTDMLLAELKTLRSQMKPHFVFNSLSSIQHFILESDQESTHLYLSRFSSLMRKILENTSKDSINLEQEIDMLELYLSLEKLRFGKNFDYSIVVDPSINRELCEVPPMLIQPYVENAIWHGLLPKREQPRLWLRFYMENHSTFVCETEDNGIGRKATAERRKSGHQSSGMKNIEERISILNQMQDKQIRVNVTDLYDEHGNACGTKVILKFSTALHKKTNYDKNGNR